MHGCPVLRRYKMHGPKLFLFTYMEMVPYPIELYLLYKAVAVELLVLLTFKNIIDVMSNII
jgi:hypothetical protein